MFKSNVFMRCTAADIDAASAAEISATATDTHSLTNMADIGSKVMPFDSTKATLIVTSLLTTWVSRSVLVVKQRFDSYPISDSEKLFLSKFLVISPIRRCLVVAAKAQKSP